MNKFKNYFSKAEILLWFFSVSSIVISFVMFSNNGCITLIASLIGVTSIIVNAKGNPTGQAMMIIFSIMYGIIEIHFLHCLTKNAEKFLHSVNNQSNELGIKIQYSVLQGEDNEVR